ncbi:putative MFS transporter [Aspergillus saccharolyticus JOP 1030-1]|uniref:MFS general substrate transporter n=1 Tax=Aspergillus saccharolyticus JOP 1030-1 TaxID=1450539 RepID=A0A318ZFS5_9EURO|nr:MFS general substrate transporter [Aspergillus saccharolyticus JOP 1030-1]PYH46401.1 MFS general substrate transporter [Aspergillus saccharolyticus JOP 1030-1]
MALKVSGTDTTAVDHLESIEKIDPYAAAPGIEIDAAADKRQFWMITRRILVIQIVTYFFQSLDKGILNYASIMGIKDDAHLYSLLGTILYVGILVGEYPQNLLLQKFPVAKTLSINVFIWGAVVACSAASTRFGSLMAVRFLLGTAMWYKREGQSLLNSICPTSSGTPHNQIGGLLAYGTSHYVSGVIKNWQLLFLALRCATCVWSFFIGGFQPDSPLSAKRVRHNETGIENRTFKKYQALEKIQDPVVWCCVMLILVANLIIGGLGVLFNLIIGEFGFSLLQTQLLNIAQGSWTIIVMVGSAWYSQRFQQTCLIMILWSIPAIVGTIVILVVTPTASNAGGMLIAFYCTQFFLAEGNMIISLVTRNTAGQTKKNLPASDAPRYLHGFLAHIVVYAVFIALTLLTRLILTRRNRSEEQEGGHVSHELALQDLTDRENPNFRYVY